MNIAEKQAALLAYGYIVGERDLHMNTAHPGNVMVAEAHSSIPTKDGSNGPWCIVGNDLAALIDEAYEHLMSVV